MYKYLVIAITLLCAPLMATEKHHPLAQDLQQKYNPAVLQQSEKERPRSTLQKLIPYAAVAAGLCGLLVYYAHRKHAQIADITTANLYARFNQSKSNFVKSFTTTDKTTVELVLRGVHFSDQKYYLEIGYREYFYSLSTTYCRIPRHDTLHSAIKHFNSNDFYLGKD